MDIFSHTVSGLAAAAALLPVVKPKPAQVPLVLLTGALAGALPDFDAIAMWGGYDATIGKWFAIPYSGRDIYFNQLWYSHHGVTHSLLGLGFFTGVFLLIMRVCLPGRKRKWNWTYAGPFALAYFMHILEDMPTPGSVWEGVMLFCPIDCWVGGTGNIWWWHNYDLFLLFLGSFVINVLVFCVGRWVPVLNKAKVTLYVYGVMLALCAVQIARRDYDYDYVDYTENDYDAKDEEAIRFQREVLGDDLTDYMLEINRALPLPF